jgi:hypothetical protein
MRSAQARRCTCKVRATAARSFLLARSPSTPRSVRGSLAGVLARRASRVKDATSTALVDAIAEGRVSVETAVRALAGSANQRAVRRLLREASTAERQRIRVRELTHDARLLSAGERALRRHLVEQPGIHVGRGVHYRKGLPTDEFSLVVHVHAKRDVRPERAIPKNFSFRYRGRFQTLPVDVKQIASATKQAAVRPGNLAIVDTGTEHGALSAIIQLANSTVALISGHVAGGVGGSILGTEASGSTVALGTVTQCVDDDTMDAAVVGPVPTNELAYLTTNPATVRDVSTINQPITVDITAAQTGSVVTGQLVHASAPATFGTRTMSGLIEISPCCTQPGDSGSPAFDSAGALLGFVVGASATNTYLIPAKEVLYDMLGIP